MMPEAGVPLASAVVPAPLAPDALAPLRRFLRVTALVLLILVMFVPVWIPFLLRQERLRAKLVQWFYWCVCRILGLHVLVHGTFSRTKPLLVISNHISYLDIFAIGGLMPVAFTPKIEISRWPVIGYFSRMAGCVFIDRRPRAVDEHRAALDAHLATGARMVLFPEGTTGDGADVLPFRSAFFRMVEWEHARSGNRLTIQPLAIIYTHLDDQVITAGMRPQVAWIADADFAPHWFALMGHRRIDLVIDLLPAFQPEVTEDRKVLAARCEEQISASLQKFTADAPVLPS